MTRAIGWVLAVLLAAAFWTWVGVTTLLALLRRKARWP